MALNNSVSGKRTINILTPLTIAFTLLPNLSCSEKCTLRAAQSPELRGFRLGMILDQIQQRFHGFPTPAADELGLAKVIIDHDVKDEVRQDTGLTFVDASQHPEFNDVSRIYLQLVDGRVTEIEVYYQDKVGWKSVDEFVTRTAEALDLKGTWEGKSEDSRSLVCADFYTKAGIKSDYWRSNLEKKLPFVKLSGVIGKFTLIKRERDMN